MLSNSRILAQGIFGTNTVILLQADSSYLLILGTYAKKNIFTVLDQRTLSREEALQALEYIHTLKSHKTSAACTLLLDTPEDTYAPVVFLLETKKVESATHTVSGHYVQTVSPYFPTKEIFLASQMTCAPNAY